MLGVSVTLIVLGVVQIDHLVGFLLIVLGFIAGVLFSFHSRIRGLKFFDKIQMPIAAERGPQEPEQSKPRRALPEGDRPPSLREVREAAQSPTSERRRRH